MNKKVILELTNAYGWAYIPEVEGERIDFVRISTCKDYDDQPYDYSTEFACIMAAFIDFNDTYSITVNNFLNNDRYDTLVIKSDLMQYVKKINTVDHKKLLNDLSHAYKTIKMAGHRRPDVINYQTDHGKIDEYCVHNMWEAAVGDVKECTYEFSNLVEDSKDSE